MLSGEGGCDVLSGGIIGSEGAEGGSSESSSERGSVTPPPCTCRCLISRSLFYDIDLTYYYGTLAWSSVNTLKSLVEESRSILSKTSLKVSLG